SALTEEPDDRVRLREDGAVVGLEYGRLAERVQPRELGGERLAREDVDRNALVVDVQQGQEKPDLEAVPGRVVVVEPHSPFNDSGRRIVRRRVVWPVTLPGSWVTSTKPEAAVVRTQGRGLDKDERGVWRSVIV